MSTTERELVRIVEGREIPPAGYWTLDPAHTQIGITWNQALETGGFLIGKGVGIEIDAAVVLDSDSDIEA